MDLFKKCSFCGKGEDQVSKMFVSNLTGNCICSDCVKNCGEELKNLEEIEGVEETKKHNKLTLLKPKELKAKLDTLSGETYQSFIFEARSKEIASLITNMDNDECYLKLIDEVIVNEDNSITIIDNAGIHVSKESINKNIKKINSLEEVLHGYYTSPITTKVYKYKIVRLEDYPWLKK